MLARAILDFVFPPQCGGCNAIGTGLCDRCLRRAPLIARKLPSLEVYALGEYEGPLRRAILALKRGRRDVAEAFAGRLAPHIEGNMIIVPIPTTAARRRQRGFDGCELIARIACPKNATVLAQLSQVRGDSQRGRTRDLRLGARARFGWRGESICDGEITLFDDVVTTGATLEDCAEVLRRHGAIVRTALVIATA